MWAWPGSRDHDSCTVQTAAMGQIPRSTERILVIYKFLQILEHELSQNQANLLAILLYELKSFLFVKNKIITIERKIALFYFLRTSLQQVKKSKFTVPYVAHIQRRINQ